MTLKYMSQCKKLHVLYIFAYGQNIHSEEKSQHAIPGVTLEWEILFFFYFLNYHISTTVKLEIVHN